MRYFGKRVEDLVVAAGTALFNNNLIAYEQAIDELDIQLFDIEEEIIRAIEEMGLSPNSNELRRMITSRNLLERFITLFEIYWVFLSDGAPDYSIWAYQYNKYYNRKPIDIFNTATIQDAIDVSSFEYRAFIQLRTTLNPTKSGQPDIPISTNTTLYYILPKDLDLQSLRFTNRLPQPNFDDFFYIKIKFLISQGLIDSIFPVDKFIFFDTLEKLQKFYTFIFPQQLDETAVPSVWKKTTKVNVAECEIPLRIIDSTQITLPSETNRIIRPNEASMNTIDIYSVEPIYISWISIKSSFEYQISRPLITGRPIGRAKIGTGRMKT